jgi:hypothetical protein
MCHKSPQYPELGWTEAHVDLKGQHETAFSPLVEIVRAMCKTGLRFGQMTSRHLANEQCIDTP